MEKRLTKREKAWQIARENQARARQLKQPWRHYFFQCQAYLYIEADLTYDNEQYLKHLIDHLEDAQAFDSHPDFYLHADPDAYARFILRKTKAPRFDEKLGSSFPTLMLFIGVTFLLYSFFIAIRGWQLHHTFVAAINMPVPISLLGLPLQVVLAMVLIFLVMEFIHQSAYGTEWRKLPNLLLLLGGIFMGVLFIFVPYLSLSYQVFIFNVPVWLIWGMALIYGVTQFLQTRFAITERLEQAIAKRAATSATKKAAQSATDNKHTPTERKITAKDAPVAEKDTGNVLTTEENKKAEEKTPLTEKGEKKADSTTKKRHWWSFSKRKKTTAKSASAPNEDNDPKVTAMEPKAEETTRESKNTTPNSKAERQRRVMGKATETTMDASNEQEATDKD
ncbi:MAG: hypothetical protein Q4A67_00925 [Aerococcus sp.]|nr:hypothetical protein [Aerococcus sp.]